MWDILRHIEGTGTQIRRFICKGNPPGWARCQKAEGGEIRGRLGVVTSGVKRTVYRTSCTLCVPRCTTNYQYRFNAGPASQTVDQHWIGIGSCVYWAIRIIYKIVRCDLLHGKSLYIRITNNTTKKMMCRIWQVETTTKFRGIYTAYQI